MGISGESIKMRTIFYRRGLTLVAKEIGLKMRYFFSIGEREVMLDRVDFVHLENVIKEELGR